MKEPNIRTVNAALESIVAAERPDDHPRSLARRAIAAFRSNAQRDGLPMVNLTTGSGAAVLDVDAVLRWEPRHMGRK